MDEDGIGIDPGLVKYLIQYGASSVVAELSRWTRPWLSTIECIMINAFKPSSAHSKYD